MESFSVIFQTVILLQKDSTTGVFSQILLNFSQQHFNRILRQVNWLSKFSNLPGAMDKALANI